MNQRCEIYRHSATVAEGVGQWLSKSVKHACRFFRSGSILKCQRATNVIMTMPTLPRFSFGHLCSIRLVATLRDDEVFPKKQSDWEDEALRRLRQSRQELQVEIESLVSNTMPKGIIVESVEFRRGSVEILVSLATVMAIYTAIAQYHDFSESIELFINQLKRLFRRFLPPDARLDSSVVYGSNLRFSLLPAPVLPDWIRLFATVYAVLGCLIVGGLAIIKVEINEGGASDLFAAVVAFGLVCYVCCRRS